MAQIGNVSTPTKASATASEQLPKQPVESENKNQPKLVRPKMSVSMRTPEVDEEKEAGPSGVTRASVGTARGRVVADDEPQISGLDNPDELDKREVHNPFADLPDDLIGAISKNLVEEQQAELSTLNKRFNKIHKETKFTSGDRNSVLKKVNDVLSKHDTDLKSVSPDKLRQVLQDESDELPGMRDLVRTLDEKLINSMLDIEMADNFVLDYLATAPTKSIGSDLQIRIVNYSSLANGGYTALNDAAIQHLALTADFEVVKGILRNKYRKLSINSINIIEKKYKEKFLKDPSLLYRIAANLTDFLIIHEMIVKISKNENLNEDDKKNDKNCFKDTNYLTYSPEIDVLIPLAKNINTYTDDLRELANHEYYDIREAVAGNPNTDSHTLLQLAKDDVDEVRVAALSNLPVTPRDLERLVKKTKGGAIAALARNRNYPLDKALKVYNQKRTTNIFARSEKSKDILMLKGFLLYRLDEFDEKKLLTMIRNFDEFSFEVFQNIMRIDEYYLMQTEKFKLIDKININENFLNLYAKKYCIYNRNETQKLLYNDRSIVKEHCILFKDGSWKAR